MSNAAQAHKEVFMRWFNVVRVFLVGALVFVFGCANEDNFLNIDGTLVYGSQVVEGAEIVLLDAETFEVIDQATSDPDGYFVLATEYGGDYLILAGLEAERPLMAEFNFTVDGDLSLDLEMEEVIIDDPAEGDWMPVSENPTCWTEIRVWHFCKRCCYFPSTPWNMWCTWQWC